MSGKGVYGNPALCVKPNWTSLETMVAGLILFIIIPPGKWGLEKEIERYMKG
jgi:hypothetical protein